MEEIETSVQKLLLAAPQSGAKFLVSVEPGVTQSEWTGLTLESILGSGKPTSLSEDLLIVKDSLNNGEQAY